MSPDDSARADDSVAPWRYTVDGRLGHWVSDRSDEAGSHGTVDAATVPFQGGRQSAIVQAPRRLYGLPDDVLRQIMEYLACSDGSSFFRARATCRRLNALGADFRKLRFPQPLNALRSATQVKALAMCCRNLTSVDLSESYGLPDEVVQAFAQACPKLESVNLRKTTIGDAAVRALAEHCPNLTTIDLSECAFLRDEGFRALAECPNLTSVRLSETEVTSDNLLALATCCKELESVDLGFTGMGDAGVEALAECPKLSSVNLSYGEITDASLEALAKCPKLTFVDLSHCPHVTDAGLKNLKARGVVVRFRNYGDDSAIGP